VEGDEAEDEQLFLICIRVVSGLLRYCISAPKLCLNRSINISIVYCPGMNHPKPAEVSI